MRSHGSAAELQRRRQLALDRVKDGYTQREVATFLGVHERTVRRWVAQYREQGEAGLWAKPHPGRPPKLCRRLANLVLGWLRKNPKSFGFARELWTGAGIATLIRRHFQVKYHPNYISAWLLNHGFSQQKPKRQADRRDAVAVQRFVEHDWPRLQNEPAGVTLIW
jgi:transposase